MARRVYNSKHQYQVRNRRCGNFDVVDTYSTHEIVVFVTVALVIWWGALVVLSSSLTPTSGLFREIHKRGACFAGPIHPDGFDSPKQSITRVAVSFWRLGRLPDRSIGIIGITSS